VKHVPGAATNLALLDNDGYWRQVWTEAARGIECRQRERSRQAEMAARLPQDLAPNPTERSYQNQHISHRTSSDLGLRGK
jgi:hypothetical protein